MTSATQLCHDDNADILTQSLQVLYRLAYAFADAGRRQWYDRTINQKVIYTFFIRSDFKDH